MFTCVTHGAPTYVYWRVNGLSFLHLSSEIRNDIVLTETTVGENEQFTLTILSRAEYNGTRFQCVAGDRGIEKESKNASLNIQGISC